MAYEKSTVIITGASRGIGRVIARTFAQKTEHPLFLIARTQSDLKITRDECLEEGAKVAIASCDLTQKQQVTGLALPDDFPPPGIIINNAGIYLLKQLQQTSYEDFLKQIKTNLFSAVHVVDRFLDDVKDLNRGLIINICSFGALEGLADSGAYATSKHALLGYTRSLRQELLSPNIGVTALNLGQTQSTSWEGSSVAAEKLIDPQDVAELLVTLTKFSPRTIAEEITLKPQHGRVPPM